jgi:FkbM family methyltransferase
MNVVAQTRKLLGSAWCSARFSRPALNEIDQKLSRYLDFEKGFFIEAGANDGFTQSNTYRLERTLGWTGLLIEAIPELFERCRQERRASTVRHCALVADDYDDSTVEIHFANLMSTISDARKTPEALASHIGEGLRVQGLDATYSTKVPARTLTSVLDEVAPGRAIDFFSLDVEGYELNVLRGLDFERYAPRYLLVEATYFEEVNSYLLKQYEPIDQLSHHDYLYHRRSIAHQPSM